MTTVSYFMIPDTAKGKDIIIYIFHKEITQKKSLLSLEGKKQNKTNKQVKNKIE